MVKIFGNESLDDLILKDIRIIQKKKGFRFAIDAVLLAHFATVKRGDTIIDLGTGTGIIPLILQARETNLKITGIEIQTEVADMARRSILYNNLNNIEILQGDFTKLAHEYNDSFDLVVSNPPYYPLKGGKINPDVSLAISRHEIKCKLSQVVKTAARLLKGKGRFALIHRAERLGEILKEFDQVGLEPKRLQIVHPYLQEKANLILLEGIKGAKPGLEINKPLVIYENEGQYTRELLDLFYGGER